MSGDAYSRGEDTQSLVVTLKRILTYFRSLQNTQKLVKVRTFLINKIHSYFSDNLEILVKFVPSKQMMFSLGNFLKGKSQKMQDKI